MAGKSGKKLKEDLLAAGFTAPTGPDGVFFSSPGSAGTAVALPGGLQQPWELRDIGLRLSGDRWVLDRLHLRLVPAVLEENLLKVFSAHDTVRCALLDEGLARVLALELTRESDPGTRRVMEDEGNGVFHEKARQSPHGLAGAWIHFGTDGKEVVVNCSQYYFLGVVPASLPGAMAGGIASALGISTDPDQDGPFEFTFDLRELFRSIWPGDAGRFLRAMSDENGGIIRQKNLIVAVSTDGLDLRLVHEERNAYLFKPCLESLEQRETREILAPVNQLLREGKTAPAVRRLGELAGSHPPVFVLRRMALLACAGQLEMTETDLTAALGQEPQNLLFLSVACRLSRNTGDRHAALTAISEFAGTLLGRLGEADRCPVFDLVLPEALGIAWEEIDDQQAVRCFERLIRRRGELPRILIRMILLTERTGDLPSRISLIRRLIKVENRRPALADLYFLLATLVAGEDQKKALGYGLSSLKFGDYPARIALYMAELFRAQPDPRGAVQVLSESVINEERRGNEENQCRLEMAIGDIWLEDLQRPDIARNRFEKALALAGNDKEILLNLDTRLNGSGSVEGRTEVLERIFEIVLDQGDREHAGNIRRRLMDLYKEAGRVEQIIPLTQRWLDRFQLKPVEINELLTWREERGDWRKLYEKIMEGEPRTAPKAEKAAWHGAVGELCRYRLAGNTEALEHFRRSIDYGNTDEDAFRFVADHLVSDGKQDVLASVLQARAAHSSGGVRVNALQELVNMGNHLQDQVANKAAADLLREDPEASEGILVRLQHFQSQDDAAGLRDFVETTLPVVDSVSLKNIFLEQACEILEGMSQPERDANLNALYHHLKEISPTPPVVAQRALDGLPEGAPDALRPWLILLLEAGQVPEMEEGQLLGLLEEEPWHRALFHELQYPLMGDLTAMVWHATEAAELFRRFDRGVEKERAALLCLGRVQPLSRDHLDRLLEIAGPGFRNALLDVLGFQLNVQKDPAVLSGIHFALGRLHSGDLGQPEAALPHFMKFVELAENRTEAVYQATLFTSRNIGQKTAAPFLLEFLADDQNWENRERLDEVLALVTGHEDSVVLSARRQGTRMVERAFSQGNSSRVIGLEAMLADHDLSGKKAMWIALEALARKGDMAGITGLWYRRAQRLENRQQAERFLSDTEMLFQRTDQEGALTEILRYGVEKGFPAELPMIIEAELRLVYAMRLFQLETNKEQALSLLRLHYESVPGDTRCWIPLYFLLRELSGADESWRFLNGILPRLEQDATPLRTFPVTVESLKDDRRKLEEELGIKPASAPVVTQLFLEGDGVGEIPLPVAAGAEPAAPPGTGVGGREVSPGRRPLSGDGIKGPAFNVLGEASVTLDWRKTVNTLSYSKGMTKKLLDQAFEYEIEKHVALQCFAVISSEAGILKNWHLPVWRRRDAANYAYEAEGRLGGPLFKSLRKSNLHELIRLTEPVMEQVFYKRFDLSRVAAMANMDMAQVKVKREILSPLEGFPGDAGLGVYQRIFAEGGYRFYHLPGLAKKVFYHNAERGLYFDLDYYRQLPSSIFFHRVMLLFQAVKWGYHGTSVLDPARHIEPLLNHIKLLLGHGKGGGLEGLKQKIQMGQDPVVKALHLVDKTVLADLVVKVGTIDMARVRQVQDAVWRELYSIQFAETLDLFGICESVLSRDLTTKQYKPGELLKKAPRILPLLELATRLDLQAPGGLHL